MSRWLANKCLALSVVILGFFALLQFQGEKAKNKNAISAAHAKNKRGPGYSAEIRAAAAGPTVAEDLAVALQLLDQVQEGEAREEAAQQTAAGIVDSEIIEMLNLLAGDQRDEAASLRAELLLRWAASDPAAAATWAAAQSENQPELLPIAAATWADTDLENARQWVSALAPGPARTTATITVGYEAARTQPLVALEMMNQMEAGAQRDALLIYSASQWAGAEPEKAMEWARNLPENDLQDRLVSEVAVSAASTSGAAAANLLATTVQNEVELDNAAVAIIQRWAQTDPLAAAAWIEQFPDTPTRHEATENLMTLWGAQDQLAALKWASQQQVVQK